MALTLDGVLEGALEGAITGAIEGALDVVVDGALGPFGLARRLVRFVGGDNSCSAGAEVAQASFLPGELLHNPVLDVVLEN